MELPGFDEKTLLEQIAAGDERSFRKIYDHYRPKIYAYALHLTRSTERADEVIQEVFLKVWLKRRSLTEIEKFNGWLHTVARHCIFDAFKKLARERAAETKLAALEPIMAGAADAWLLDKENEVWLNDALEQLTPSQKQIFIMSRRQGMTAEQIAAELNISVNTVGVHMVNLLASLRNYIRKHTIILAIIMGETLVLSVQ